MKRNTPCRAQPGASQRASKARRHSAPKRKATKSPTPPPARWVSSLRYWSLTLSAVAVSFWVGLHLPTEDNAPPPAVLRSSLPPATGAASGVGGLAQAASQRRAAEIAAAAARAQQAQFTVPPQFQGKTIAHVDLAGDRKLIALTFDDGPWPGSTNAILYILRKHNVQATFFLLGRNIQNFPGRARQIAEHGHAIANHSWSHPYRQQTPASAAGEIDNTDIWIERATGVRSQLFRPPGGHLNNGLAAYAASKGQVVVMWSGDSKDYYASSAKIFSNIVNSARPGGIVLLHDGGGDRRRTIEALPKIITTLRQQGYEFVTVPELLELHHQQVQASKG